MQEFFMDYGLWLLIGLLVVIGLVFLLSGRGKAKQPAAVETVQSVATPVEPLAAAAPVVIDPVAPAPPAVTIPDPVEPVAVEPAPPASGGAQDVAVDDLLKLKGVGPKLKTLLIELGVTRYAQIAAWSDADIAAIDAKLGNFKGRPVRDQWVDQARYLASGDIAGFESKYGKM